MIDMCFVVTVLREQYFITTELWFVLSRHSITLKQLRCHLDHAGTPLLGHSYMKWPGRP